MSDNSKPSVGVRDWGEPWKYIAFQEGPPHIIDRGGGYIAGPRNAESAAHIIACVNACRGFDPEKLRELLLSALSACDCVCTYFGPVAKLPDPFPEKKRMVGQAQYTLAKEKQARAPKAKGKTT